MRASKHTYPTLTNTTLDSVLVFLFLLSFTIRYFIPINQVVGNAFMAASGLYCALYALFFLGRQVSSLIWKLLLLDAACLVGLLCNGNYSVLNVVLLLSFQSASILVFVKRKNLKLFSLFLALYLVYFGLCFFFQVDPDYVLNGASRNFISIIILSFLAMVIIDSQENGKGVNPLWYIVCFAAIVWAQGRNGILSMFLLILGSIAFALSKNTRSRIQTRVTVILILLLTAGILFQNIIIDLVEGALFVEGRLVLWQSYGMLAGEDGASILFGGNLAHDALFLKFTHVHNQFLGVHSYYGLIPLLIFLVFIAFSFITSIKYKKYSYILLLCVLTIRSMTDMTSFPDCFDFAWYFIFFDCLAIANSNKKSPLFSTSRKRVAKQPPFSGTPDGKKLGNRGLSGPF